MLGRATQGLIDPALRGVELIDLAPIGIHLVIAQAERNFPLIAIHLDDLRRDVVTRLELLFHANVRIESDFADMNQTLDIAIELDEESEIGDLADLAGNAIADPILVGNLLFPRIA